ncbi:MULTISPECIES: MBL fold metallo-hydrolase [unclassified Neisseria]|uniref:MBL fold metallo-hydrolase n=1 Tax=unclassified Neisseria TaxID=2623750 RepID=UPI002666DF05|nr:MULTISPECIES: MBL fold metallo-hydrolase [unclassified Neisseria]MDO1509902.1 MBL fold metallo-hydrolase [Neisseria sp. MVDL19-042950]MDO1516101.1 MBL fold metallo-hydrolase [Neisseria sp. MVDL18-041461]MDO1563216.1 MBL fold metallo-hydrolase [Neisseria sp. MVDL20-010259]
MYSRFLKPKCFLNLILALAAVPAAAHAAQCTNAGLDVVVLGSGGPELSDKRASTGYLVRENGKARFIIDFGAGSSLNFERAGGDIKDLEALLFTHFHVDHSNDLPALVKASYFSERNRDLPVYGPTGNHTIPTTPLFVERQFGEKGVYPYLSDFLTGEAAFALKPIAVNADKKQPKLFETKLGGFTLKAIPVEHGLLPSLGWRIEKNGCSVTVSGDTSNIGKTLDVLAKNTDIFIAHNAVPESASDKIALKLHMMPSEIGRIAQITGSRSVVLSHFMHRTEKVKPATSAAIRKTYQGKLAFAQDCDIYSLKTGMKTGSCKE